MRVENTCENTTHARVPTTAQKADYLNIVNQPIVQTLA